MASFNFGLLELADGESGEAAVCVVVGKAKAEAAQAKKAAVDAAAAESAAATGAEKEKAALKNLYFHKLQHDNGSLDENLGLEQEQVHLEEFPEEEREDDPLPECPNHLPSTFEQDGQVLYGYCINCLYPAGDEL